MSRVFLAAAFFASIVWFPFPVSVVFAIVYLAFGGSALLVASGGVLADFLFGAPVALLHGFAYLSTVFMLVLAAAALLLRRTLFQ